MNKFLLKSSAALMAALFAASSATFARRELVQNANRQQPAAQMQPPVVQVQTHEEPPQTRHNPVPGIRYQGTCTAGCFTEAGDDPRPIRWSFINGVLWIDSEHEMDDFCFDLLDEWDACLLVRIVPNTRVLVLGNGIRSIDVDTSADNPETIRDIVLEQRHPGIDFYTTHFPGCRLWWGPLNAQGIPVNSMLFSDLDNFLIQEDFGTDDEELFPIEINFNPTTGDFVVGDESTGGTATYRYVNGQFVTIRPFTAFPDANNAEDANNNAMSEEE